MNAQEENRNNHEAIKQVFLVVRAAHNENGNDLLPETGVSETQELPC